jgi:polyisoprenoid-binding protein YceI
MAAHAGRLRFDAGQGKIVLLTARDGLAAQAGHDLTIEITQWSAELEVGEDLTPAGLTARAELNSLVVREGTGGVKPLSDRDRRDIAVTARRLMRADRYPVATFTAAKFDPGEDGGGTVQGTLSLAGTDQPLRFDVARNSEGAYHATASVRQSDFGIKPYTAFLGVLKVSDVVRIAVAVRLPEADPAGGAGDAGDAGGAGDSGDSGERP